MINVELFFNSIIFVLKCIYPFLKNRDAFQLFFHHIQFMIQIFNCNFFGAAILNFSESERLRKKGKGWVISQNSQYFIRTMMKFLLIDCVIIADLIKLKVYHNIRLCVFGYLYPPSLPVG